MLNEKNIFKCVEHLIADVILYLLSLSLCDFCFHFMQIKSYFALNCFYSVVIFKWNFMRYELFSFHPVNINQASASHNTLYLIWICGSVFASSFHWNTVQNTAYNVAFWQYIELRCMCICGSSIGFQQMEKPKLFFPVSSK